MTFALRFSRQLMSSYYALMLEYRAEIVLWVLAGVFPFIVMGIWMKASGKPGFALNSDLTPVDFARYFLAVFIVRQFTIVWVIWEVEMQVVEGRLSASLLKPVDPVWTFVAMHLSEQMTRFPFWILLVAAFFLGYPAAFWSWPISLYSLPLTALALMLAFTLRFLMQYTFSLLSFWIERASSIEQLSFLPYLFLSGLIAPITLFPPAVRTFASYTPFPYLIYFPAEILTGKHPPLAQGFAVMLAYIVLFFGLNRLLWRHGLKHYSAMGA